MIHSIRILGLLALGSVHLGAAATRTGAFGLPTFPAVRGFLDARAKGLTLVGTGVRVREGVPFYSVAYYANLAELKALAGPGPYDLNSLAKILVDARVSQAVITRFHQSVSRDRRKEFLMANLRRWWPNPIFDEHAPTLLRFLEFFDEPIEREEETQLWFRGGVAFACKAGGPIHRTPDRSICRAFLASYLSGQTMPGAEQPLQADLIGGLPELLQRRAPVRK